MKKHLLIIGFVWPEPNSSAAGSRMLQLINVFISYKYQITFASTCSKAENAFDLSTIGVNQVFIELNNSSFDVFVKELNPDVVVFDRFMVEEQFGWRVAEQCPNALRILDTEDLHCLRKGRQLAFKDGKPFDTSYLFNDTAKRELAGIYRSDLSFIISEVEMEILQNQFKIEASLLCYIPFMQAEISEETISKLPNFIERHNFITIGNFVHQPNYNGLLYLKDSIWPLIKTQLPHAEMHIYGSYLSQKGRQLHNEKEGFLIKGFTKDVHQVMQTAKVCLATMRFGAGLKGKLIDAMQNGTPCVMTNIAAEGIFGNMEPNGFISDKPQEFANMAVNLYNDEHLWNRSRQQGFEIINGRFSKVHYKNKLIDGIQEISKQLSNHRQNNFIGQMLQHHTLQSTKFMSKWIEEKNASKI